MRPGFTPPEDVGKYKNAKVVDWEAKALPKGAVVGRPAPQAKNTAAELTAAQKKNMKRKEKRKEEKEVPDAWDAEEEPVEEVKEKEDVDVEKRLKALQKKLRQVCLFTPSTRLMLDERQAEQLKERLADGEPLLPEQQTKVDSIPSIEAEIASLTIDDLAQNTSNLKLDTDPSGQPLQNGKTKAEMIISLPKK